MKILFSPSEAKHTGGAISPTTKNDYIFPDLFDKRMEIIAQYQRYIKTASPEELAKLFGTKKDSVIDYYKDDTLLQKTMKVIERYDGVAFDYLDYATLDNGSKGYIDTNVIIFSNLFGPLLAGNNGLPEYKLKQGEKVGDMAPKEFSHALNRLLETEHYLDLHAGFYNKFYKPTSPYTTLKFIKDGKVVSHWEKAYRGIVLREIAKNNITDINTFMHMNIKNISVIEIIEKGIHTEVVYAIIVT